MDALSCPVETQLKPCASLHVGAFCSSTPAASILALGPCIPDVRIHSISSQLHASTRLSWPDRLTPCLHEVETSLPSAIPYAQPAASPGPALPCRPQVG